MTSEVGQVQAQYIRRSRRQQAEVTQTPAGEAFAASQEQLQQIDTIINGIVNPSAGQQSVVLGEGQVHNVRSITSEQLVRSYRQQSGE